MLTQSLPASRLSQVRERAARAFNSLTFVVFAIVVALHNAPLPWRAKKFNLLIASYLFYAAWNPPFVILLLISTMVDWKAAQWIHGAKTEARRKLFLVLSLAVNLGFLGFFKYGGFLLENFTALMGSVGVAYKPPEWDIILPVGISFYTFQTMAYSLDVYLRRAAPTKSFLDFALFVTFSRSLSPAQSCVLRNWFRNSPKKNARRAISSTGASH